MDSGNRHKSRAGLARIGRAFGYSIAGLRTAVRNEHAFRQELGLVMVLLPVAALLPVPLSAKALLVASLFLLLIVELLNSAIEAAVDRISLDDHVLARNAKDIGSAAVFLALVNLCVVWVLVLWDRFG